ncbi:MAG: hypothetical protein JNM70_04575 [Anaerolineae bacterium]|nr:hypothetical protein [Anaerolineae bacterium]
MSPAVMPRRSEADFAPYFRNGRLYLPPKTIHLLQTAGLDDGAAQAARNGLDLDDHQHHITAISGSLAKAVADLPTDTQEFRVLTSSETQFALDTTWM